MSDELRASAEKVLAAREKGDAAWVAGDPNALLALLDERDAAFSEVARLREALEERPGLTEDERLFVETWRDSYGIGPWVAIIDRLTSEAPKDK